MAETWSELLARQHGVFTVAQALGHGLTRALLLTRERDGLYRTVAPRTLYAAGAVELPRRARLWRAVLSLDQAVLSHTTAAQVWELRLPRSDAIHVSVPRANWREREGIEIHTVTSPTPEDRAMKCGLPVTALERSLIDAFALCDSQDDRRTLVAEAFRGRRTTSAKLSQAVLRMPLVPRRAELFQVIELAAGGGQSAGEMTLYEFMLRWSLPAPVRQYVLQVGRGRRYVDCALPSYRLAIEYDGRLHLTDAGRHDDQLRDEALRRLQWVTVRVSDRRLRDEARLAADIWANLAEQSQRLGRGPGS